MSEQKFKKGTDGYAQAKAVKTFCIVMTFLLSVTLITFLVPGNYFNYHFKNAAIGFHIAGILSIAGQIFFNWKVLAKVMDDEVYSGGWVILLTLIWYLLSICLLAGFNFSIG